MKNSTKNKLRMYKSVKTVIGNNTGSWTGLPAFETASTAFSEKLTQLIDLGYSQAFSAVGTSAVKKQKRKEIVGLITPVIRAIQAYANINNDMELRTKLAFPPSYISTGSGVRSLQLIDLVIEKANLHFSELEDFGVTEQAIQEIEAKRAELDELFNAPRQAIIDRKKVTSQIRQVVKEIDGLLKGQMDLLIESFKSNDPEFYAEYKFARVIVDLKGGGTAPLEEPEEPNNGS